MKCLELFFIRKSVCEVTVVGSSGFSREVCMLCCSARGSTLSLPSAFSVGLLEEVKHEHCPTAHLVIPQAISREDS